MRRSVRFLAILACALPLACSDTSRTPTATSPPPAPRLAANPASNGSIIVRFDDWVGWWYVAWYDPGLDMIGAVTSYDMVSGCGGGDPAVLPSDWKVVQSGKFEDLYHRVGQLSEVYIFIYDGDWSTWGICKPPIMRGIGTARTTDNDVTGTGGNGANAWGVMASGQVTDGNGQAYRYSGHVRGVTNPDGTYKEELSINLFPIK